MNILMILLDSNNEVGSIFRDFVFPGLTFLATCFSLFFILENNKKIDKSINEASSDDSFNIILKTLDILDYELDVINQHHNYYSRNIKQVVSRMIDVQMQKIDFSFRNNATEELINSCRVEICINEDNFKEIQGVCLRPFYKYCELIGQLMIDFKNQYPDKEKQLLIIKSKFQEETLDLLKVYVWVLRNFYNFSDNVRINYIQEIDPSIVSSADAPDYFMNKFFRT
jgi:hypothetical protein